MQLDLIAGARPNFVKLAALIHAIENSGREIKYRLIHTGQHYDEDLSGSFFRQLGLPEPHINLQVGSGSQAEQTAGIMTGYETLLKQGRPDMCVVVGDVTSSMACAITAKKMQVKVAHVEAGIRSGDWNMPEEVNRVLIDSIADHFFTTTQKAADYLVKTGAPKERVHFVGNTMIDTLLKFRPRFVQPPIWKELDLQEKNYFILTLHRPGNVDEETRLKELLIQISIHARGLPVLFPVHPRTIKILRNIGVKFENLHLTAPLPYLEFNFLVERARAVITDSGGITEETTVLGVPCMTFRNSTERPETITEGTNELLGTDPQAIAPAFEKLFTGDWRKGCIPELWDGKAGERIIRILKSFNKKL